jgi:hypothetical protein
VPARSRVQTLFQLTSASAGCLREAAEDLEALSSQIQASQVCATFPAPVLRQGLESKGRELVMEVAAVSFSLGIGAARHMLA